MNPRKKPKFRKQGANYLKRIKDRWRKPRGRHSKLRESRKGKGKKPNVGYASPKNTRYLHPSGLKEKLVKNQNDLKTINPKEEAARLSATFGKRKKAEIVKLAKELKIKILNP